MVKKYVIKFRPAESSICAPVTKFGGQPFWLTEPQWPLSRATGEPMRFICQIALPTDVFGETVARMAYLFMSDSGDIAWSLHNFDPDAGENAIILQPGQPSLRTTNLLNGPTLFDQKNPPDVPVPVDQPCEFAVDLTPADDPEFVPLAQKCEWNEEQDAAYNALTPLDQHKIGGAPHFLQGDDFPQGGPWRLLLQLSSCGVPFYINFGDLGVGYAFINHEGTSAKFLWQCD